MIGIRYSAAIALATEAHAGQVRKGSGTPYIAHPIAVSALVLAYGGDEDQAIGAVCHDVIEDCAERFGRVIYESFGQRSYDIVKGCSDYVPSGGMPKPDWWTRKRAYIQHMETAAVDVAFVSLCDKLHNATCIVEDLEDIGDAVFERFTLGKEATLWYYGALLKAFRSRRDLPRRAVDALAAAVARMDALAA
jgi:(p)ppGpp synthase/HD superfamily hydrolase